MLSRVDMPALVGVALVSAPLFPQTAAQSSAHINSIERSFLIGGCRYCPCKHLVQAVLPLKIKRVENIHLSNLVYLKVPIV